MSRVKRLAHSLVSGFASVGANTVFTLASVPLAFHYLSIDEFGLYALVTQMANFNVILIDLGMSGALSRILVDHKDDKASPQYGTVIQTGCLVLGLQGALICGAGILLSIWLPEWMNVPERFWAIFRSLMIWQCVVLGIGFVGRIFSFVLQAHQRYDVNNYATIAGLAASLAALWVSFDCKLRLYSMLTAFLVGTVVTMGVSAWAVRQLDLLPAKGRWGRPSRAVFRELFAFGTDLFLLTIGQQLIVASQVPVVSRSLGLPAAAVWSVAVKVFVLAQQVVYRVFDFSYGALSEMVVRGEHDRLRARFRDIVVLTGSAAAAAGAGLALCNQSFLAVWTPGVSWHPINDLLMAVSFFVYASTRLHVGLTGVTKQIGSMKYVYFMEGTVFVLLGLFLAPHWNFAGVILSGVFTNILFSGIYGSWRTMEYFHLRPCKFFVGWLARPLTFLWILIALGMALWLLTAGLGPVVRLIVCASGYGTAALILGWHLGLSSDLRREIADRIKGNRLFAACGRECKRLIGCLRSCM